MGGVLHCMRRAQARHTHAHTQMHARVAAPPLLLAVSICTGSEPKDSHAWYTSAVPTTRGGNGKSTTTPAPGPAVFTMPMHTTKLPPWVPSTATDVVDPEGVTELFVTTALPRMHTQASERGAWDALGECAGGHRRVVRAAWVRVCMRSACMLHTVQVRLGHFFKPGFATQGEGECGGSPTRVPSCTHRMGIKPWGKLHWEPVLPPTQPGEKQHLSSTTPPSKLTMSKPASLAA